MRHLRSVFLAATAFAAIVPSVAAQQLTVPEIMGEPSIAGMRVEGEKLSPDGSKVVFLWNSEGRPPLDIYIVPTEGSAKPSVLLKQSSLPVPQVSPTPENKLNYGLVVRDQFVKDRDNAIGGLEWSPDSKRMLFTQNGDLYLLAITDAKPRRLTKTQAAEFNARFVDNNRVLYQQSGNLFVLNLADASVTQLTKEADAAKFIAVGNATVSKDGSILAYVVSDNSKQRGLFVPNYLNEYVEAPTTRRGWSEQKVFVIPTDGSRDNPFEIKLPKQEGNSYFRGLRWAADNRSLIIDRNDKDTKRRQLFYIHNAGGKDEQQILVIEETDDKWQAPLSAILEPNPKDPSQLFFTSEHDGFNHIYLAKLEADTRPTQIPDPSARVQEGGRRFLPGALITQLTKGNWQVEWAKWTPDGAEIFFSSTEQRPSERRFFSLSPRTDKATVVPSQPMGAMRTGIQMNDEGTPYLLFSQSRWNEPDDLFAQRICPLCSDLPTQLTHTVPTAFPARWNAAPKFIDIPSRDGKQIKSKIYVPTGFDAKKKYPMVVFVHGAGYLQNTINGWNNYYREFMFNELLAQRGYVVLDIDYRGSAGYGREWRTDVYDFLGGKDYDDEIDAIDFMIKNYGVDAAKVGVYGGSYGGFMAEMLAFRGPEKIAAAAALRPVADWKNYYASSEVYTAQRLGYPDKNPEAYKRSSPISYADGLKTHLLILHGIVDSNVHVEDSMQLTEKLIRLGKTQYFEEQFYPSENHGFVRPESWTDEYTRILNFFEKYLK